MRLFAALPLPGAARARLAEVVERLRIRAWPVRWVRADRLHLTVRFYGEVTEPAASALGDALEQAVAGAGPIPVAVGGLGTLPRGARARVLHAAVAAPPGLELLHDRVERAGVALGYSPEGKPFRPHVTLGRVRQGGRWPGEATRVLEETGLDLRFAFDRLVLYRSTLTPEGPDYTPVRTLLLAG